MNFEVHMQASTLFWVIFLCLLGGWLMAALMTLVVGWRRRRKWLAFDLEPRIEARPRLVVMRRRE